MPRLRRRLGALLVGLTLFVLAFPAWAANDEAIREAVQQIMNEDYPGSLGPARKRLQEQLSVCLKKGCNGATKAEVQIALGMVAAQQGQTDDAKQMFKNALGSDPSAKLPSSGVTPAIRSAWDDVKGAAAPVAAAAAADTGDAEPSGIAATVPLIRDALKADQEGNLEVCIEKDQAALKIDNSARTRLHLASCEARANKLVDALNDLRKTLEAALQRRDQNVMRIARKRFEELVERIPHVTFDVPSNVDELTVEFDGRRVPKDDYTKKFSVDPGKHKATAEGVVNGVNSRFEEEYEIKEKELLSIRVALRPITNGLLTDGQIRCMIEAKTQEEMQKCIPQNQKNLVVRMGADFAAYSDTNNVAVYTPSINASIASPTSGWNIGGNFLVDAVSAASPDIVASASPPFREYRYGGGLTGGYKPGLYGAQASVSTSSSPDYVSYTGGIRLVGDFHDKLITPSIGYQYSYDRIARGPNNYLNDFDPLKGYLHTHEFEAGITFVLTPTSLLLVGGTLTIERGDGSQPYRYIPMFDPVDVSPFVPKGATVDLVNQTRLPVRPLEQLPTQRDRIAIGARYNKRLKNATFRLDQRFYADTWQMKASSTDVRYMVDLSRRLRVWPHGRLHMQTDVNFYNLTYTAQLPRVATPGPGMQLVVPLYRTTDRELSPLLTGTAGGGLRVALGEPEGKVKWGLTFVGDVMYTRFLNSIYVTGRTAVYGSLGLDVEF